MAKQKISQIAIVKTKIRGMSEMIAATHVSNDIELAGVADKIKQVKTLEKFVLQEKKKYTEPAERIIAEAREQYDPYIKECRNAEIILKERARKYMIAKDEKRTADEKKIADKVKEGKMEPETAITKLEKLPEEQKTVRSDKGSALTMNKRKVADIQDRNLIPDEYWIVDEKRVKSEALERYNKGLPQIPGMVIRDEVNLSSH